MLQVVVQLVVAEVVVRVPEGRADSKDEKPSYIEEYTALQWIAFEPSTNLSLGNRGEERAQVRSISYYARGLCSRVCWVQICYVPPSLPERHCYHAGRQRGKNYLVCRNLSHIYVVMISFEDEWVVIMVVSPAEAPQPQTEMRIIS